MLNVMDEYMGTPIDTDDAWRMIDGWQSRRQEIGVIFWGGSLNLYTLGIVESTEKGRVQLKSAATRAAFNLANASFKYGPMQTWPRWPSPPIVEVLALRAEFKNGDYLALAEGLMPPPVAWPSLPE